MGKVKCCVIDGSLQKIISPRRKQKENFPNTGKDLLDKGVALQFHYSASFYLAIYGHITAKARNKSLVNPRIAESKHLLLTTTHSITSIYLDNGYHLVSGVSKTFTKVGIASSIYSRRVPTKHEQGVTCTVAV